jgi:hypothetical protein
MPELIGAVQYLWATADNMLSLDKVLLSSAYYYRAKAQGQQEFVGPGTYNFIVPANVESIAAVAVGGGGGGAENVNDGGGGGGGALAYANNIPVTPGEVLTVTVGQGGAAGSGAGTAGTTSSVLRSAASSRLYDNFETVGALGSKWVSNQGVTVKTWGSGTGGYPSGPGFASSGISGSSAYLGFTGNAGFRQATTQPQDLTRATKLKIRYIYGNGSNGGEQVDSGEYLGIALSANPGNASNNSGYTNIIYPFPLVYSWTDGEIVIPSIWKRPGVYIRIYQLSSDGSEFDHIGIDNFTIDFDNNIIVAAGGGQPGVGDRGGNGGTPTASTSDLNASSVVMLLTGDGIDGSQNFVDSSPNPKAIGSFQDLNGQGYPLQTTRFKKFGSGSIDFNGASSFYVTGGTDFVLGGDFTIDGWLWVNNQNQAGYQTIWELNDYRNGILFRFGSNTNGFYINGANRGHLVPHFPILQWNHFAVVRSGSTVTVYANGTAIITFTETGVINSGGGPLRVGESAHTGGQFSPPMYLDEFRITKGVARYTSNFVPPATSSNDTTSLTSFTGNPGGKGGNGSTFYGDDSHAGGGGGAGGYTASGGTGGDGRNYTVGDASLGGGGGGGASDNARAFGGGGTGIKGIANNGTVRGGGGSSYNSQVDFISSTINSQIDFSPVSLDSRWSNFLNTYGVWYDNGTYNRGWYAPYTGTYIAEFTADNYIDFKVNGKLVGVESNFGGSQIRNFTTDRGIATLSFYVLNYGGPAGFAVTIRDINGTLLWDTRTYASRNTINRGIRSVAAGTAGSQSVGGFPGGGGGGKDGSVGAGAGGGGAVRIIWGSGRSYPYNASDVTPIELASLNGLILYYDAENAGSYSGGNTVFDISGNSNHGTISLGYAPATVPALGTNKVIRFPATENTKIDFNANELTATTITVEMWAIAYTFASGMFFGFNVHDVWTSSGFLGYNTGQGDVYGISNSRINSLNVTGRWTHYVFVMTVGDYRRNKIYVNGVSESLTQQTGQQLGSNANFNSGVGRIGGWRNDNNYQQVMDLGVFKIYNRELTQAEITTNYNEKRVQYSTPVYYAGLWGKRVSGYYNDDVNFLAGATAVETRAVTDFAFFSSYSNSYSWEFKGYFKAPADGTYTFQTTSDDASHLWIGATAVSGFSTGNALVNNGGLHGYRNASGAINLLANVYYPIRVHFGENFGADGLIIYIYGPTMPIDPDSGMALNGQGYFFHDDTNKL